MLNQEKRVVAQRLWRKKNHEQVLEWSRQMSLSSELALSIGLMAGYLAFVLYALWPEPHCKDCPKRIKEKK